MYAAFIAGMLIQQVTDGSPLCTGPSTLDGWSGLGTFIAFCFMILIGFLAGMESTSND